MRILALNGSRILGGGEIGTALLLAGMRRRGHDVTMLCRDERMATRIARYGIPTGVQHVGGGLMLQDALRLTARVRRQRPDAVILTTFKKVFLTGLAARMAGVPLVVQRIVLQGDTPARGALYRMALRHFVDVVTLNANSMRTAFLAGDPRLDASKVVTILDGVASPTTIRERGAVRRELGIPPEAFVIGSVSRLARQKRFDRLLRALARIPERIQCIIAGEGDEMEALRSLAVSLGINERVHLTGFRDDVGDVLDAMDLYVVSSDREGLANAMLEAMAVGLPVVSTDVSGAHEALDSNGDSTRAGIVTRTDEAHLSEAISGLARDSSSRRAMGRAAKERAERHFGVERFLNQWENLLTEGVGRRGAKL